MKEEDNMTWCLVVTLARLSGITPKKFVKEVFDTQKTKDYLDKIDEIIKANPSKK